MIDKSWNPVENGGDRKALLGGAKVVAFTSYDGLVKSLARIRSRDAAKPRH